ncbi:ribonuclease J [Nitrosophilus labii]|uniref:ribonuclease J n=1 Tax=Nitrosophilus labii TaxID=2706014 RepID=UPI0016575D49|nr:ribonuclease J [Nitrosophilus labii]
MEKNLNHNQNLQQKSKNSQQKSKKHVGWYRDIKKAIEANEKIQKLRLNPDTRINLQSKGKVKITPLGGLGEIGGNITVIETDKSAIIIDVGMSFPTEDMHGVDILVPDFTYLRQIKDKIDGIVITHAHEDHIGAVPYLFKEMQFPIYGTPLPLGMIANKFDEHNMRSYKSYFRFVEKRRAIKIGDFEVEWIHITHSIIDASALAITCDAGTIFHTGDFKIDHTPIDGYPADLQRIAYYGEKGVLALLSDSTNSHNPGITKSEASVGPTFDLLFSKAKGRVIMSTFSSNIHRVHQAIEHALKYNRKVCVIGRSMERNLETAMQLGYVKLPQSIFIEAHELNKYSDNEILIVTTGSQGETMSALYRMATNEHRHVKIKPSDTIIISAKAIPGNERSVSSVINMLQKCGATVAYQDFSEIHVSGHAAQEEQKLMLRLTKPKFFLPVHGEYNHLMKHKETAIKCGIPEKNIYLMSDGEQIEITPKYLKKVKTVRTGKSYIDNQLNEEIESDVVIDRQRMATEGIVMVVAQISATDKKLINKPKVSSFGLVADKYDKIFAQEIEGIIENYLSNLKSEIINAPKRIENELRQAIRKHIFRKLKKYPTIVPTIFIM